MDLGRQLADALRRMRQDVGLTHAEMAKRLGISRPTYTRLENVDQNTTLKTLTKICRALRCDVGELLRGEARTAPQTIGVHVEEQVRRATVDVIELRESARPYGKRIDFFLS